MWLEFDELEHPLRAPLNVRCSILSQIDDPHRRDFASMTMILDNAMKKVVGTADDRGFYENSVFIAASDNALRRTARRRGGSAARRLCGVAR